MGCRVAVSVRMTTRAAAAVPPERETDRPARARVLSNGTFLDRTESIARAVTLYGTGTTSNRLSLRVATTKLAAIARQFSHCRR